MAETTEAFIVRDWCRRIIEGCGGMNDYETHEFPIWDVPDRVAAVEWAVRCLANPQCKGSAEMLSAIIERRNSNTAP